MRSPVSASTIDLYFESRARRLSDFAALPSWILPALPERRLSRIPVDSGEAQQNDGENREAEPVEPVIRPEPIDSNRRERLVSSTAAWFRFLRSEVVEVVDPILSCFDGYDVIWQDCVSKSPADEGEDGVQVQRSGASARSFLKSRQSA